MSNTTHAPAELSSLEETIAQRIVARVSELLGSPPAVDEWLGRRESLSVRGMTLRAFDRIVHSGAVEVRRRRRAFLVRRADLERELTRELKPVERPAVDHVADWATEAGLTR